MANEVKAVRVYGNEIDDFLNSWYAECEKHNGVCGDAFQFPTAYMYVETRTCFGKQVWIALCNDESNACWVEEFDDEQTAIDWLEGRCDSEGNPYD